MVDGVLAVVAQEGSGGGGFTVTPFQAFGALILAIVGLVTLGGKFAFEKYLPTRQTNQATERKEEREHEQSLVSKLTDQSAALQNQLFDVVTERLGAIEQSGQSASAGVGKLEGQIEGLISAVRSMQLEVRELKTMVGAGGSVEPTAPVAPPPKPNPRPRRPRPEPVVAPDPVPPPEAPLERRESRPSPEFDPTATTELPPDFKLGERR